MNSNMNYLIDVMIVALGLFSIVYIIYGRIKNQSLIGGYKPGKPGYDVFKKIVSTRSLVIVSTVTIIFGVSTVFDILSILRSDASSSELFGAPIAVVVAMIATFTILPFVFKKQ
jgi:hypothetical protein